MAFTDRLYHMEKLGVSAADGMVVSRDGGHLVPFVTGMPYYWERDQIPGSLSGNTHKPTCWSGNDTSRIMVDF